MKETPDCLHMMLERIKGEPEIVDLNGHGVLQAEFKCGDCGTIFFKIAPSHEKKPKVI